MQWNFDITQAPRGKTITETVTLKGKEVERDRFVPDKILICVEGEDWVGFSHWIPKEVGGKDGNRWNNIGTKQVPFAWMPAPKPPQV